MLCSTPEGVIVGFTAQGSATRAAKNAAQRPRASSSGSPRGPVPPPRPLRLLNARGRHRRVHPGRPGGLGPAQGLLNARGRHRRVHPSRGRSRWPGRAAQRPRASSSGSLRRNVRPPDREPLLNARGRHRRVHPARQGRPARPRANCSTPEGVIVGFTPRTWGSPGPTAPAQRPRASSSGSRRSSARPAGRPGLLNARGRHRRVHAMASSSGPGLGSAQRPRASSSGSPALATNRK